MEREKQIEEMAKFICNACEMGGGFDGKCAMDNNYKRCGICIETAEALYNAGYRKEKQGKWEIKHDDYDCLYIMCSACKNEFYPLDDDSLNLLPNYCLNCGARMVGDSE